LQIKQEFGKIIERIFFKMFNRKALRNNYKRICKDFSNNNFIHHEIAHRIIETVFVEKKFSSVLEIGSRDGYLSDQITYLYNPERIIKTEIIDDFFAKKKLNLIADDEFLPFKKGSFDLIVSNLNLHFYNFIPQFLLQTKSMLKPGGIFIASFFGEENLSKLARVLFETESEICGGISPRMPPLIDVKTAANLFVKAGFLGVVSTLEKIEVSYKNAISFLKDLKSIGLSNIMNKRSARFFTETFLNRVCENYETICDGEVIANYEIIIVVGKY
jgi:SAM-dependent methyltransferase